jgi:hypothetical protein
MKFFSFSAGMLALAALSLASCKKDEPAPNQVGTVDLAFEQTVGTAPLTLNTRTYTTPAGDEFKINVFKQYISNIKLNKTDGSTYAVPESYFLLDASDASTLELPLKNIPVGDYKSLTFTVGVDSARNVSGAQTGALDPNKAMFWTWNSGYIYTKFEGTSPQATKAAGATEGGLVFHIGGFKSPNNTIRTVTVPFPTGSNLLVRSDHSPEVHLNADVLKMFVGPNPIRFATLSNTMGGANSVLVANNYAAGMFSVEHIHAN